MRLVSREKERSQVSGSCFFFLVTSNMFLVGAPVSKRKKIDKKSYKNRIMLIDPKTEKLYRRR